MKRTLQFIMTLGLLLSTMVVTGQVTTSSINGRILEAENEPLLGATVQAVHTPTGTQYATSTNLEGFYRIPNMRVGGPYTITITYIGKNEEKLENIFLQLGESENISITMTDEANALDAVVITAVRDGIFDSGNTGTTTNISTREINTLPTATRSIGDILRKTPQASVDGNGAITIGGQNNRFNSLVIDGAVNNDVFGLAASGTNGGQIGINPISLDAIESFQVNIAPFDVRQSGFTGGQINAITRSGTNNWEGSVYYFTRNENLAGKTPQAVIDEIDARNGDDPAPSRERLDEFSTNLYGVRVGGPIIENKLFFFVNAEVEREETPRPFDFQQYTGNSRNPASDLSQAADPTRINALRQGLIDRFGYNPGGFEDNVSSLDTDRFTMRLDWNINNRNTLTLKHNYVRGESVSPSNSSPTAINFGNNGVLFPSETNFTTLEWNTSNGRNLSNKLIMSYTSVRDDRNPIGNPFPDVTIFDGSNRSINFGSEAFSTGNVLEQDVITVTNNFQIQAGAHNITIGGALEAFDVRNVFVRQNFGSYSFSSLDDFETYLDSDPNNNAPARSYDYSYSLLDPAGTSGDDINAAAAAFNYAQLGFYVQDEWSVTDNFNLTYGVRFDLPFYEDGTVNNDFNNRTIPLLESQGKDLQGARSGLAITTEVHVAPRLGFNWDVNGDKKTQVRGGLGIFTSRIPLVWPGGTYNNNGLSVGGVDERNFENREVFFNADPLNQPIGDGAAPGSGSLGGQIDLFAPNFKLPQVAKYNIGVDQKLGIWGLIASADFLYNETINNIQYENINIGDPIGNLEGADNRPLWSRNRIDQQYSNIYLATNTNEGWSYNASFAITKPFENGFSGQLAYSYGQAKSIFEGTSSQNSSQWRNIQTVNGKNNARIADSEFGLGHRITANAAYQYEWNDNIATTFSFFYNGQQGNTVSYIYEDTRGRNLLLGDDSRDNALIFVPATQSDINLVPFTNGSGEVVTAEQQWQALDSYISGNSYLNDRRGDYAERNGDRGPWNHIFDVKILQDFSLKIGEKKHTFQLSADIFNFFNFLNKDWGRQDFIAGNVGLITTETDESATPEFTFDPSIVDGIQRIDDAGIRSSRWQAQLGLRYIFN
jgi:hypothetical protein